MSYKKRLSRSSFGTLTNKLRFSTFDLVHLSSKLTEEYKRKMLDDLKRDVSRRLSKNLVLILMEVGDNINELP